MSGEGEGEMSVDMIFMNFLYDIILMDGVFVMLELMFGEESDGGIEKGSCIGLCLFVCDGLDLDLGSWGFMVVFGDDDGEEKVKEWVEDDGLNKWLSGLLMMIYFGKVM